ncbi:hypothetical protein Esti_005405 [Eimeria stiedai]
MSQSDHAFDGDPSDGECFYLSSSSSSSSSSRGGFVPLVSASPTAAAKAAPAAAAARGGDRASPSTLGAAVRSLIKPRLCRSPTQLEEQLHLVVSESGRRLSDDEGAPPLFHQGAPPKAVRRLLHHKLLLLLLLLFLPLLTWSYSRFSMHQAMRAVFAAEKAAAAAATAAAAAQRERYNGITSAALRGLASMPAGGPRALSCWGLQRYLLPQQQLLLQQQRDAPYGLLHPAAAAEVPATSDILEAAPWNADAEAPLFTLDDWAEPFPPQQQQQQQQQQPHVSVCTYEDPRYGVVVTAPLASLVPSAANGCRGDSCELPFWWGPPSGAPSEAPSPASPGEAPASGAPNGSSEFAGFGGEGSPLLCAGKEPSLYNGCFSLGRQLATADLLGGWGPPPVRTTGAPAVDEALFAAGGPLKRRIVHFVSGPDPLTPRELWALDAAFTAMPGAIIRWHLVSNCAAAAAAARTPAAVAAAGGVGQEAEGRPAADAAAGTPTSEKAAAAAAGGGDAEAACLTRSRETHFAQMQLFWRRGFDLQYVQHMDLQQYLKGLPLERHAAVLARQPLGPAAQLQRVLQHMLRTLVADLMRLAVVYVEGGVYMDTDVIALQEMRHISNFVTCEVPQGLSHYGCASCQAVFSFEAGHTRLRDWMANAALLLDNPSSSSSSSRWLQRLLLRMWTGGHVSEWSWDGRTGRTLEEMLAANRRAEEEYLQSLSSSSSEDESFVRMLLLPWGTIGTKALRFMLDLWARAHVPHLDARVSPPSLVESLQQQQQQPQQQQQQLDLAKAWPGLTRILGKGPPTSAAAMEQHLQRSRALQQQQQQQQQDYEDYEAYVGLPSLPWWQQLLLHANHFVWGFLPGLWASPPAVSFPSSHLSHPSNDAAASSSLTLYGPQPFYPLSYGAWLADRLEVTSPLLWGPSRAPEGLAHWRQTVKSGRVYALHLYSTMIFAAKGDISEALKSSKDAAIGVLQRSYCGLLCGHQRLALFGGPESSREITNELSETAKRWLKRVYAI